MTKRVKKKKGFANILQLTIGKHKIVTKAA
jgi:hypothetical protein